jgi:hypothetical protein
MNVDFYRWPTRYDYDKALADLPTCMLDEELKASRLVSRPTGLLHRENPDNPVCLYQIELPDGKSKMVRCFSQQEERQIPTVQTLRQRQQLLARYEQFSRFSMDKATQAKVAAVVPVEYVSPGIRVMRYNHSHGRLERFGICEMPIVKMDRIIGESLGSFVEEHHSERRIMRQLCEAWRRMIDEMEDAPMAHGDLDLTNVLVIEGRYLSLKLIDYDNAWITGFDRYDQPEHGHEAFQHPASFGGDRPYNAEMDRFSALVMYLSLLALSESSNLYTRFRLDEAALFFSPQDYQDEIQHRSGKITALRNMNMPRLAPYLDELCDSLHTGQMPRSLRDIADGKQQKHQVILDPLPPAPPSLPTGKRRQVVRRIDWSDADINIRQGKGAPMKTQPPVSPYETEPAPDTLSSPEIGQIPPASALSRPFSAHEQPTIPAQARPAAHAQGQLFLGSRSPVDMATDRTELNPPANANVPGAVRPTKSNQAAIWVGCAAILVIVIVVIVLLILLWNTIYA